MSESSTHTSVAQELQDILSSDEVREKVANSARWFAWYPAGAPEGEIVQRDDKRDGKNDPVLSEQMRLEADRLWTKVLELFPTSGGSDGFFLVIQYPWEIDNIDPSFGYWNSLTFDMTPLSIEELLTMYEESSHQTLLEWVKRGLNPTPYGMFDF